MVSHTALDVAEGQIDGTFRTDLITRLLYATDASPHRMVPQAVLAAGSVDDIHAAVELASSGGISITPRGAGTSLSGQCVGDGLQLDVSGLDAIEWIDPDRRLARVQPGATWWGLNLEARKQGLEFGPDPATRRQCTLAGMVASNAGGTHSITYGATVDHIHAVEARLADGRHVRLGLSSDGTLSGAGVPVDIATQLEEVRRILGPLIGARFRSLARRGSGYQIEHLCVENPNAAKLLAGSDGTLGLITAIELELDPPPASRVLSVVGFEGLHAAMESVPDLVETAPCAIELVSQKMISLAAADPFLARSVQGIDPDIGAFLFVEYQGSTLPEAVAGFDRMQSALPAAAKVQGRFTEPKRCAEVWGIREAGVGAMSSVAAGPKLPQAFVEDTIVAIEKLPPYIREFEELFRSFDMEVIWYGHASTGLIHVRPFVDMTDGRDLQRIRELMKETVELVKAWGGDLCGEHGDGIGRSYWNESLFGEEIYGQLRAIKAAFDPKNLFNPGKVVEGPDPLSHLRYGTSYSRVDINTAMGFEDQGGFSGAAERCFGAGVCRKRDVGTMCPPAAATGQEEHSTRARANLLRSVVSGELGIDSLGDDRAKEVMDTCVMCKACKVECPARVDMARMKVEWMDGLRQREGASNLQRTIGRLRGLSMFGSRVAPLANAVTSSRAFRKSFGIASDRTLPKLASRPLSRRLPSGGGDVALFADCFTTYQEPEIGEAGSELLKACGTSVSLKDAGCCGRVMLSEGYVDRARRSAGKAAAKLREFRGPILFFEPSCMSAVTDDWPHLVGDVSDISSRARLVEDHFGEVGAAVPLKLGGKVLFHSHCHQKALWGSQTTTRALSLADVDIEEPDSGCCGMAGSFGYREEHQSLSRAMAERVLVPQIAGSNSEVSVVATGTSCRHQIGDLTDRDALHPVEFLASRL